ncbi:phage head-tail connector protein [Pediococcus pentosaceus]|uniref:phage head-tail connector protein n=1 Tax=Pediococcus pentosaceus TaxID=1255 RepID=UPI001F29533D|nr:phage head-tail connector protein [Pediococcus pentosaceus]
MDNLKNLKVLIAMNEDDTSKDNLLNLIVANTEASLKVKLHKKATEKVPDELNYILLEVAVRRFNRLKNEGMANYSQEGETITFNSNDFDDFKDDINKYLIDNKVQSRGVARFI